MVKNIYMIPQTNTDTDYQNTAFSTRIIQSSDTNLDIMEINGSKILDLVALDEVNYYDKNNVVIFGGAAREPVNGDKTKISCFDYGIVLGETPIRKNFENMTALAIIQDVVNNYTNLTYAVSANVVDSAPIILYPSRNKKAIEIIEDMHNLLGTTHYVDKDKVLTVELEGDETNTIVLTVGANCDISSEGWVSSTDKLALGLIVNGDNKRIEEVETFTGDGIQDTFTLANPYVDIKVEFPAGSGTYLAPFITDITSTGDYQIRKETKKLIFESGSIPTGNFNVFYVYDIQTNYTIPSTSTDGNDHTVVINKDYLKEVVECRRYAEKYYEKFSKALRSCKLIYQDLDLTKFRANQRIKIVDNTNKVNGSFVNDFLIIKEIIWEFGSDGGTMELVVGDSENFVFDRNAEISQKVKDLNEVHPIAEIFNESIRTLDFNRVQAQFDVDISFFKKANLPSNVLVYDASRTYINEADRPDPPNEYVYINEADYEALFTDV